MIVKVFGLFAKTPVTVSNSVPFLFSLNIGKLSLVDYWLIAILFCIGKLICGF